MVADCLPIFLSSKTGKVVAVIHAGWRGLANGVIEETLDCQKDEEWIAWIGPAIGPCHYEVKQDVLDHFESEDGFAKKSGATWSMDLAAIAEAQFRQFGVLEIYGGGYCTYCDEERFFSYRRDGKTGRMAGFIWLE
jgi:YfiH family protein